MCETYIPTVVHGTNDYIEYHLGGERSKLIILAPHGGDLRPESIQDRNENKLSVNQGGPIKVAIVKDLYTKELSLLLRDFIVELTSEENAPHLILCNLHRLKMDANRNKVEATLENPEAITAYEEYQSFIKTAKKSVGIGLLVDIHGQSHPEEWVELGYMISKQDLTANILREESCSIRSLAERTNVEMEDLIRGSSSLGYLLQSQGVNTIPSPVNPKTMGNFFYGAYTTYIHGSLKSGTVDAIQIETPRKYRNQEGASDYVRALSKALVEFMNILY